MCRPCLDVHINLVSSIYCSKHRTVTAVPDYLHSTQACNTYICTASLSCDTYHLPRCAPYAFSCDSSCAMRARSSASRPAAGLTGGGSMDASMPARPIALRNAWSRSEPQRPRPSASRTPSCAVYPGKCIVRGAMGSHASLSRSTTWVVHVCQNACIALVWW